MVFKLHLAAPTKAGRTATSVQVSTTGFMSDCSQGMPSDRSAPGHKCRFNSSYFGRPRGRAVVSSCTGRHQQRGALTVVEAASLQSTGTMIIKSAKRLHL